jgi:hypothetical protein
MVRSEQLQVLDDYVGTELGMEEVEYGVGWSDAQWRLADEELIVRDINCMRAPERQLTEAQITEAVRRMKAVKITVTLTPAEAIALMNMLENNRRREWVDEFKPEMLDELHDKLKDY